MKHFVVATAGHVDHGKSALVKALTGTDPDRLPEEKARKITIDLGFAEMNLRAPNGEEIHAAIVDVPGHEDFVKNMIAGVGSIDLAIIVVAADDGWMPQTEEHLQILTHLQVKRAVVALTKSDLADVAKTAELIRDQLKQTPFEGALVIATSTITGIGLEELKEALASELSTLAPQPDVGKPRLFVDRAFSLHGIGTVVTGTLTGGRLAHDQPIVIQPGDTRTRIRMIQSHQREQQQARPGMRVALNLTEVAPNTKKKGVSRGDLITIPELGEAICVFDAVLTRSARSPLAKGKIKSGASVYVHHGTKRVAARVVLARGANENVDLAQITVESPIFVLVGDRFVLRDPSERRTLAGGVILDTATDRRKFRSPAQREFLNGRAQSPDDVIVAVRSELRRDGIRERANLLFRSKFSNEEIDAAAKQLADRNELVWHGDIIANADWWSTLHAKAIDEIAAHHKTFSQSVGIDLAKLRSNLCAMPAAAFDALIIDLSRNGYVRSENLIGRAAHRAVLSPELSQAAENIRRIISEKPFDPPARKQVAPDARARQALNFLIEQKELIDLGPDLVLSQKTFTEMKNAVTNFISKNGPATVSELRQLLQTSRRTAVPFLERLDRERVTQRLGDRRTLVEKL